MFDRIFEPVRIGTLELKNRLVFPVLSTNQGSEEGAMTDLGKNFYAARAQGGVGLVITGSYAIDPRGHVFHHQFTIYEEEDHPALRELVKIVQGHGAKVAFQLHHAGSRAAPKISGTQPVTSSPIPHPIHFERPKFVSIPPRALTLKEIREMVERYAWAAKAGKELGFDAVEIHSAHAHLVDQFLSPLLNHRRDEYGGDLAGRARFGREVVAEVRRAVGPGYPILCKINAGEFVPGGVTLEDAQQVARWLEEAGADALQVSVGQSNMISPTLPGVFPQGCFVPLAAAIKEAVSIPVIAVGRIKHMQMAEEIVRQGKADLVAMGRSLLADPELPRKAMEGRLQEIKPCIACIQGCISGVLSALSLKCTVNPAVGREGTFVIRKAPRPKKVLIVGGGPAGLEAARVAGSRGHDVFLYEQKERLGGWLNVAALARHKEEFRDLIAFYEKDLPRFGVQVRLGCAANVETIQAMAPDAVVIAAGSVPFVPRIKGIDGGRAILATEALTGSRKAGARVVVWGAGRVGCETAEFLAAQGKSVLLVGEEGEVGRDVPPRTRMYLLPRLVKEGVEIIKNARVEEIETSGARISRFGDVQRVEADTVVVAQGFVPQIGLIEALQPLIPELGGFFVIGDCAEPRTALEAIYDGWRIGRTI